MASYTYLSPQSVSRLQSPAKVFALLKSKVNSEAMCAREKRPQGGERGADIHSPRKKTRMAEELKENIWASPYRCQAQPLTVSPMPSPEKSCEYSYRDRISQSVQDRVLPGLPGGEPAFLQSTMVSQPSADLKSSRIYKEPLYLRTPELLGLSKRTPIKTKPEECHHGRRVCTENRGNMFSPVRNRLRKRKLEPQELNKVSGSTSRGAKVRKPCGVGEDDTLNNTSMKDSRTGRCPSDQSEVLHELSRPPDTAALNKFCTISLKRLLPAEQSFSGRGYNSGRHLSNQGEHHHLQSATFTVPHNEAEINDRDGSEDASPSEQSVEKYSDGDAGSDFEDDVPSSAGRQRRAVRERAWAGDERLANSGHVRVMHDRQRPQTKRFANTSTSGSKMKQQQQDPNNRKGGPVHGGVFHSPHRTPPVTSHGVSEDVPGRNSGHSDSEEDTAPVPAQPILHEDPIVLRSPTISIPKKWEAESQRKVWSNQAKFPNDSVVFLTNWSLQQKASSLFIHGTNRETQTHWNTNAIVDRVSNSVLRTVTGKVYILIGKMRTSATSDFPKWLLTKFSNGFPSNWKALYTKCCSLPQKRGTETKRTERRNTEKTKREASSVRRPDKKSDSCPPGPLYGTKFSRSGRLIKPPMEYWKGARVFLDLDMNVTIHESYSSFYTPNNTELASAEPAQTATRRPQPCTEAPKQSASSNDNKRSTLLRKVRPAVKIQKKEAVLETLSSPEEPFRKSSSSARSAAARRAPQVDSGPPKQSEPGKSSTWKSKKESHNRKKPSTTRRKQAHKAITESNAADNEVKQDRSSDDDFTIWRKKQPREAHNNKGGKAKSKSHQHRQPSKETLREVTDRRGKSSKTKEAPNHTKQKPSKRTAKTPPAAASSTQASLKQKAKEQKAAPQLHSDDEEWTEVEIERLHEAVPCFPKHVLGYWKKVAQLVVTRSAEECHNQFTSLAAAQAAAEKPKKGRKKAEAARASDVPVISARAGTLKRKQQVHQFLEAMPREDVEDVFSSQDMQNKRFELPSLCPSDDNDVTLSEMEPVTPKSSWMSDVKTPQCLHITPGMMGSSNRRTDYKYVHKLQKMMKKNQFDVCRAPPVKKFTLTPSDKRAARKCADTEKDYVVTWEVFPEDHGEDCDSKEEEDDFYFSDAD